MERGIVPLVSFGVAFVMSWLVQPHFRNLGFLTEIVDHPGERRPHREPVPRTGGMAIFISFFCALFFLENVILRTALPWSWLSILIGAGLAILALAWLVACMPLLGWGLPLAVAPPDTMVHAGGEHMPCHTLAETRGDDCPRCDSVGLACECCDHAVPSSLPSRPASVAESRHQRAQRQQEPLSRSPDPPLSEHLRPPRV